MEDWADIFVGTLIPEVPVPFSKGGEPDLDGLRKFAAALMRMPVDGVMVGGGVDFTRELSVETRLKVAGIWREILIQPFTLTIRIEQGKVEDEYIKEAAGKADYLLAAPGTNEEGFEEFLAKLCGTGVPVLIDYESHDQVNLPFSPEFLYRLTERGDVAGARLVLNSHPIALQDIITEFRMKYPNKAVLAGSERLYGYSFYRGCYGAMCGLGAVLPELQREMIDAFFMGELTMFLQYGRFIDNLAESIYYEPHEGYAGRICAGLQHTGLLPDGCSITPGKEPVSEIERELVNATIDTLVELTDAMS